MGKNYGVSEQRGQYPRLETFKPQAVAYRLSSKTWDHKAIFQ